MASKSNQSAKRSRRNYFTAFALAAVLFGGYQAWRFYSSPPQLGESPQARKTLDALFTALTARDIGESTVATSLRPRHRRHAE